MEINGTQLINESQSLVWDSLFNPEILNKCLPGCQSVEMVNLEEFKIVLTAVVGPLRVRFKGKLLMSDVKAPNSCHISFEGQGGVAGFAKGTAQVVLEPAGDATQLSYQADAQIGGKLAQVGARMIEGVAKKIADDFFSAFRKQLSGDVEVADSAVTMRTNNVLKPLELKPLDKTSRSVFQRTKCTGHMVPAWWLIVALFSGAAIVIITERLIN